MKHGNSFYIYFFATGIITLFFLSFITSSALQAANYASTARGADVYVLAQGQNITVGQTTTVDILVTNDSTPLNAMEAELYFDPSLFDVTSVSFGESLCEDRFIIDNVIDNTLGRIHLSCGTVTPFTGNATIFGSLSIVPKKAGVGKIEFGIKTNVYVHDGMGTQIARDKYDTTFVISNVL